MATYSYNPKRKGSIDVEVNVKKVTQQGNIPATTGKGGFFSKRNFKEKASLLGKGIKKTGRGILKAGRATTRGVLAADKTQRAFKTEYYNRRKLALERRDNIAKHKANISGLKAQQAQSKADLLEARHKQYQVRQQARLERNINRGTSSGSSGRYNIYGKSGGGFFGKGGPPKGV